MRHLKEKYTISTTTIRSVLKVGPLTMDEIVSRVEDVNAELIVNQMYQDRLLSICPEYNKYRLIEQ